MAKWLLIAAFGVALLVIAGWGGAVSAEDRGALIRTSELERDLDRLTMDLTAALRPVEIMADRLAARAERWAERNEAAADRLARKAELIGSRAECLGRRIDRLGERLERRGECFGRRMERFGERMERLGDRLALAFQ